MNTPAGLVGANPIPLYLMAKAPVAGRVKTRMAAELGAKQSAALARLMLEQTVAAARLHWPGDVALCVWPDSNHPVFTRLAAEHRLAIRVQTGGDLGARMMSALRPGIERAGCAAVMGCDAPHCPGEIFAAAHAMLARGENPLGPTADGGFYLIGLQQADDSLFRGVHWGGQAQADEVRARATAAGLRLSDLPPLRDIDRYPDLVWLAGVDAAYRRFVE